MAQILVRYAEIALKGRNRPSFEKQLVVNIQNVLEGKGRVVREYGQILVEVDVGALGESLRNLQRVFGVAWFAPVDSCASAIQAIVAKAVALAGRDFQKRKTFAVRAARSVKTLDFVSKDVEEAVGEAVRKRLRSSVDLENPQQTIFVSVGEKDSYLFTKKIRGLGGLPVGTGGKVLSLLSGGIDSIASSFLLAKRGARVDFLHFHAFAENDDVLRSKMPKIWKKLSQFTLSKRVFLASSLPFQMRVIAFDQRQERYALVLFRRLMIRVGEQVATSHGYQALVLGDCLGQVASQTMENMVVVDRSVSIPLFRPVIGFDKRETVSLVKDIGLEAEAAAGYKDCCSILSPRPATAADLGAVERLERELSVGEIVREVAQNIDRIPLIGE